jgi:hypothetical protein
MQEAEAKEIWVLKLVGWEENWKVNKRDRYDLGQVFQSE